LCLSIDLCTKAIENYKKTCTMIVNVFSKGHSSLHRRKEKRECLTTIIICHDVTS
jgi:hypothetical protein